MNCPIQTQENRDWLLEYSAGRLDRERAAMLDQHVAVCPACAQFVAGQRVVWDALGQWESPELSPDFNRRLYQKIDAAQPSSWLKRWLQPLWRPLVPVAATCLLIVAGLVLHTPAVHPVAHVESVEPEQVERTLDDLQMLRELAATPAAEANTSQPM